jgi:two-component system chemotaxis response regulator CheY
LIPSLAACGFATQRVSIREAASGNAKACATATKQTGTTAMRILIIDDSRAMRAILRSAVKSLGFEATEACNGEDGLMQLVDKGPFDVALVDWNMPVMNGLEFVSAVRAKPEYLNMRLVMVTTEVEMSQVAKALQAGADEYVMKPFTNEILREKLELLGVVAA